MSWACARQSAFVLHFSGLLTANVREVNLLHYPPQPRILEYRLGNLGQLQGVSLDCWPQGRGYWTRVVDTMVMNMGLFEQDANAFTLHHFC